MPTWKDVDAAAEMRQQYGDRPPTYPRTLPESEPMTDTPVVPNDIPAILARAAAATEGPWRVANADDDFGVVDIRAGILFVGDASRDDADFIAHSRTDVPNMAAEILSLRADRKRLDVLEEWYQASRFDVAQRAAGVSVRDDSGIWNRSKTLAAAADAEIARREKENG